MPAPRPLRLAPEWDDRFGRMLGVSALGHVLVVATLVVFAGRAGMRPLPMTAYTVELTDPSALGGRIPQGAPAVGLSGGPAHPPTPEPKGEPDAAPKPPEPAKAEPPKQEAKVEPPKPPHEEAVHLPDVTKPPEPPKPEPKVEQKPPPKPEPEKKPEVAKKPEPPKPDVSKTAKAAPAKPEVKPPPATKPGTQGNPAGQENAPPRDAYAAAAERWRSKSGGGLGGTDTGSGPIGAGGQGPGGGGQLVGLEFMAYRQQVINTIKAQWANVIARPGLVAAVRFEIAPDGEVSNIRLAQSSGNGAYDASTVRAVQHVGKLPAPPARYASEFREFVIEFHSEESGGQGAG
jgi:colicin import membrane protein